MTGWSGDSRGVPSVDARTFGNAGDSQITVQVHSHSPDARVGRVVRSFGQAQGIAIEVLEDRAFE